MKKIIYLSILFCAQLITVDANAQKYKTTADTFKLNKEYLDVSNDINELSAKLTKAQDELPGIKAKAGSADNRAQDAANNSSNRADKATDVDAGDAKRAKRSAKKAYKKAKAAEASESNVVRQEKKIAKLTNDLARKQKRLEELNVMRTAIYGTIPMN